MNALDRDGYVVLHNFMAPEFLHSLRDRVAQLYAEEGDRAGSEFKQEPGCRRLANLVDKGPIFQLLIANPRVLELVRNVLGPEIKLSSLNARLVPAGGGGQPWHADMAAIPDDRGFWVCNTVWMLDNFTRENGTLRVIPGSHRSRQLPAAAMSDPHADHPEQVLIEAQTGSVVVMNAHLWHGGTLNRTSSPRTAVHAFYCRRDKPQQQYQKKMLRPQVQDALPSEVRWLLALDDPLNDDVSADVAVRSGFLK